MDYSQPGRARRVLDRLLALDNATPDDMAAVHADCVSLPARTITPAILRLAPPEMARVLEGWDGSMHPDSVAATIYGAVRNELAGVLLEREPLSAVTDAAFAEDPYPTPAQTRIRTALPRIIGTDLLSADAWDEAITEAIARAVALLTEKLGDDLATWTWERLHHTATVHPLSRVFPDAADELNVPSASMGGDGDCAQAGSAEAGLWIQHSSVARYVFDLGDWDASGWIVPTGSSGHPSSPHYADQVEDWAAVRLQPMLYSWDRIESGAESRQSLDPSR
jgi:penicillin amidase